MNSALSLFRAGAQSVSDDVVAGDWDCQPAACGTDLGPNHLPLYTGTCTVLVHVYVEHTCIGLHVHVRCYEM